jgi:acyl-CoA synthetase (AMP-forming)/AMP-acid ligase II
MTVETIRCGDWLRLAARRFPNRDCIVTDDARFTFAEVDGRVNRLAESLADAGAAVGSRIALLASNSHRYFETLLASLQLGATYVPLNFRLAPREVETLLARSSASILFVEARHVPAVAAMRDRLPHLELVICYDAALGDISYDAFLERGADPRFDADPELSDEDIVGLCFTSGTTALPKGVMHSQRMTKTLTYQTIIERRLPADAFHYSPAPLFHVAGMVYAYAGVSRGHTTLIMDFEPRRILHWMQEGHLTGCFFVPTMISTLLQTEGVRASEYAQLESIAYGAAPMTPNLLRRAIDTFGCEFINMFGAGTEAGLQTILTPEDHRRALAGDEHLLGSIGRPAWNVDLRLCDEEMNDVVPGEVGEIVTRSDGVMSGYLDMPEESAQVIVDGWFRGGDLAWQDDDGYLYLAGRAKDMIIRGGENIYPIEIEGVLADYPGVVEVAIVGAPDDHWGEIVRAHVVIAAGADFDIADVTRYCRARLAGYKVPTEFRVETELPKNASGKVLKRELRTW